MTEIAPAQGLAALETVIEQGIRTFMDVGAALLAIRDGRLYRDRGHMTFEDYCQKRWGWHERRAEQYMQAARVAQELEAQNFAPPQNDAQARELARLPDPESRAEVWADVQAAATPEARITAATVREAVTRHPSAPPPKAAPVRAVPEPATEFPEDDGEPQYQCDRGHWYAASEGECPECASVQVDVVPEMAPPASPVAPREQARAEQAKSAELLEKAGILDSPTVQQAHLRRVYFDAAVPLRSNLLFLDPDALVAALTPDDRASVHRLIRDTRAWMDRMERALGQGLHVIEGGKARGE